MYTLTDDKYGMLYTSDFLDDVTFSHISQGRTTQTGRMLKVIMKEQHGFDIQPGVSDTSGFMTALFTKMKVGYVTIYTRPLRGFG